MADDPGYKFTVFFQGHGFGPSESWYTGTGTIDQGLFTINQYLMLRNLMLFPDCEVAEVRVGRTQLSATAGDGVDNLRQSQIYTPGNQQFEGDRTKIIKVPGAGNFTPSIAGAKSTFANVSTQMRVTFDVGRSTTRYIVWPPNADVGSNKSGIVAVPDNNYDKLLIRLEQFVSGDPEAADPGGPLYIKATVGSNATNTFSVRKWLYLTASPGIIGFVVSNTQAAGMTEGALIHVRGTRRRPPASFTGAIKLGSLNGKWYVDATATDAPSTGLTTVFLKGTEGFDPTTIKKMGTVQLVQYRLYPVANFRRVRIRTHKRGKDSTVPRGRRLTRVSADP